MSKICFPKYGGPCPQWLASPVIRLSSNSMQSDAKVEKKCATSYLNLQGAQYHRIESHLVQQKVPYQLPNCRKTAFQISVEGFVLFFNEEEY